MVTIRRLMKALSIRKLQKTYANGNQALKGIDLAVDDDGRPAFAAADLGQLVGDLLIRN